MEIEPEEVIKIAHLARLGLTAAEIDHYAHNLSNVLKLAAKMNTIDTEAVEPLAHPMQASLRLREDLVTEENQRELFQSIAPQVADGLYLVPTVIE